MKLILVRNKKMNEVQYNTGQGEGKPVEDGLKFPVLQKMRYEKKLLFYWKHRRWRGMALVKLTEIILKSGGA